MIKRNFTFLKEDIVVRPYKQLVMPHLEYAVQAWNPYFAKDKEVLEKVQRRATRMISSLKGVPYYRRLKLLYNKLVILTWKRRIDITVTNIVNVPHLFKFHDQILPAPVENVTVDEIAFSNYDVQFQLISEDDQQFAMDEELLLQDFNISAEELQFYLLENLRLKMIRKDSVQGVNKIRSIPPLA
ncbi:hypothetical protein BSL78_26022 [Apostichopus japonicus]|uniref:Uncharacterized protein n=1 Tax=Stichopus japonicus TaxID=307972 RepID=A0A2G8JMY5_STIJA|nr:hypothetical protein BSL78_26022 [Apostichopus japonicus]